MLTKMEWSILEGISYDSEEPIEYVDSLVLENEPRLSAYETLDVVFQLFQKKFIEITQIPIKGLKQNNDFEKKVISPSKPIDIVGSLWNEFKAFAEKRDYLEKNGDTGVPLGIYIGLTSKGSEEIEKQEYSQYAQD